MDANAGCGIQATICQPHHQIRRDGGQALVGLSDVKDPIGNPPAVSTNRPIGCVTTTPARWSPRLGPATEIVSAHVSNNAVPTAQLPTRIQQVFNTLVAVGQASVRTAQASATY